MQANRCVYHDFQSTAEVIPIRRTTSPLQRPKYKGVKKKKQTNVVAKMLSLTLFTIIGLIVLPFGINKVFMPLVHLNAYPDVKVDYSNLLNPTTNYLYNDFILNKRMLTDAKSFNQSSMSDLYLTEELTDLKKNLTNLSLAYKTIEPSVFVWEYDSGKYVDIKADKEFSAASIIKIPVLLETFKAIETGKLSIDDKMSLTEYYRSDGSGKLKYHQSGSVYTIDELARIMIEQSDNSATNMLIAAVGGMPEINSALKNWGIKNTHLQNWLPDMAGTNVTTTKDLAVMLYNIENSQFISSKSKSYIVDYMSNVENNRLIQAGLPQNASFIHKTGDIGKTLGDAGIVTTASGKKYIVAIIANRPYNSPLGKDFIQKASSMIYNTIEAGV